MKRTLLVTMTVAALMAFLPQEANAQFFKKLGKALEKVDKALDSVVGDTNAKETATAKQATTATATQATAAAATNKAGAKPFKGVWSSDELHLNIDFYNNSIPNPMSMDEEPCPGLITLMSANGSTSYDITEAKISGSKAICKTSDDSAVTMVLQADRTMKVTLPEMLLISVKENKTFKGDYIVKRGGPFAGIWTFKGNGSEGMLELDLYGKSVVDESDGTVNMCYGKISVCYGMNIDNCIITKWTEEGNKATVTFTGGRDGGIHKAMLTYNPANGKISVSDVTDVSDCSECYVTDGMVFSKNR